jgi:regulator of protease activity HflC (stomatin/prohibitin superfamily)
MIRQKSTFSFNGYGIFIVLLIVQVGSVAMALMTIHSAVQSNSAPNVTILIGSVVLAVLSLVSWAGFYKVEPNEGKIFQLFGNYAGTDHKAGLRWTIPVLFSKTPISLKVRNFESNKMKVNDASGSPIEIAAVVVWKVADSAEAFFEVDDFESFVTIQSESALRNLANQYPYESAKEGDLSLRADPLKIAEKMKDEIQERLNKAGVEVIEARISHLAYATEIAQAMLRKQQAGAVLAARKIIVQGAVEMVTDALKSLTEDHDFELDDERKASMVSNLLVVICGEQQAQPVVNAGTIY